MTDLFEETQGGNNQNDPSTPQSNEPNMNDLLAGIKNENGEQKFKSIEDLMKGYQASQEFISTLKNEKTEVLTKAQELAAKVKSQEELAELLNTSKTETKVEIPEGVVTADDVASILEQHEQKKKAEQAQAQADSNVISVKEAMKEAYGAGASEKLKELTEEAGLDKETAGFLAAKNPQSFLKLLGVESKKFITNPGDGGSINTQALNGNAPTQAKSVMGMSSSKDMLAEWKASGQRTLDRLNNS